MPECMYSEPLLIDDQKGGPPIFDTDEIWFNGTDKDFTPKDEKDHPELSHETFTLFRKGSVGFCFCKTAQKPYDLMVQACLLVYRHYSPDTINLGSDGDEEDWEAAVDFVHHVLGYWAHPFDVSDI